MERVLKIEKNEVNSKDESYAPSLKVCSVYPLVFLSKRLRLDITAQNSRTCGLFCNNLARFPLLGIVRVVLAIFCYLSERLPRKMDYLHRTTGFKTMRN